MWPVIRRAGQPMSGSVPLPFISRLRPWHLSVLAILLTLAIVSGFSLLFHGRITHDYLITGFVAALLVCYAVVGLSYRRQETLRQAYDDLERQVRERTDELMAANKALWQAQDELEHQVQERTADLAVANDALQSELTERKRVEKHLAEREAFLSAIIAVGRGSGTICRNDPKGAARKWFMTPWFPRLHGNDG